MDRTFPSRALVAAVLAVVLCLAVLGPGRLGPAALACDHPGPWLVVC
jgi:hypothetical protein